MSNNFLKEKNVKKNVRQRNLYNMIDQIQLTIRSKTHVNLKFFKNKKLWNFFEQ